MNHDSNVATVELHSILNSVTKMSKDLWPMMTKDNMIIAKKRKKKNT